MAGKPLLYTSDYNIYRSLSNLNSSPPFVGKPKVTSVTLVTPLFKTTGFSLIHGEPSSAEKVLDGLLVTSMLHVRAAEMRHAQKIWAIK